jgi:hypothetical protein
VTPASRPLPVLLAIALLACGDRPSTNSGAKSLHLEVTASGPLVACEGLLRLHEAKERCEPSAEGKAYLRRHREELPKLWAYAKDIDTRRNAARGCALMLDQLVAGLPPNCPVQLTADERAWVDSEAARRTTIPPTGDASIDALIAEFLELRDRMCACQDRPCAQAVDQEYKELAPRLFSGPSTAVREAGAKVIEELQHCRAKGAP